MDDHHRRRPLQHPHFGLYASSEKPHLLSQEQFAFQRPVVRPAVVSPTYLLPHNNGSSNTIPGSPLRAPHLPVAPRERGLPHYQRDYGQPHFAYRTRDFEGPVTLSAPSNSSAAVDAYHRGARDVRPSPSMQMHPPIMVANVGTIASASTSTSGKSVQSPRLPPHPSSNQSPRLPKASRTRSSEDTDLVARVATLESIVAAQSTRIDEQNKRLCHQAAELSEAKRAMSDQIAIYRSIAKISMARAEAVGALDIRDSSIEALSDRDSPEPGHNGIGSGNGSASGGIKVTPETWSGSKALLGRKRLRSDSSGETG